MNRAGIFTVRVSEVAMQNMPSGTTLGGFQGSHSVPSTAGLASVWPLSGLAVCLSSASFLMTALGRKATLVPVFPDLLFEDLLEGTVRVGH